MRYARVNHVEFESKEALAEFEAQYTKDLCRSLSRDEDGTFHSDG